ncbi:hypothetical protein SESBI_31474 [Sesbania bispinosa]|nr:hypothetical protein SESBI_31474 [Sesbania bispinosa]
MAGGGGENLKVALLQPIEGVSALNFTLKGGGPLNAFEAVTWLIEPLKAYVGSNPS